MADIAYMAEKGPARETGLRALGIGLRPAVPSEVGQDCQPETIFTLVTAERQRGGEEWIAGAEQDVDAGDVHAVSQHRREGIRAGDDVTGWGDQDERRRARFGEADPGREDHAAVEQVREDVRVRDPRVLRLYVEHKTAVADVVVVAEDRRTWLGHGGVSGYHAGRKPAPGLSF